MLLMCAVAMQPFNQWLIQACQKAPAEREKSLAAWSSAPGAREAHPREEHLLPLMVVAGAAAGQQGDGNTAAAAVAADSSDYAAAGGGRDTEGHVLWDGECMGVAVAAVAFGDIRPSQ